MGWFSKKKEHEKDHADVKRLRKENEALKKEVHRLKKKIDHLHRKHHDLSDVSGEESH